MTKKFIASCRISPPIRDPGDCRVIGGNGEALDLRGFAVLPVTLGTTLLWHEFGVVPNLPLEVLIGADILAAHRCSLLYLKNNQKRLIFGQENCAICDRLRNNPEVGSAAQLKFVERVPRRRRNRLRIGANFVATLPEATDSHHNRDDRQTEQPVTTEFNADLVPQLPVPQQPQPQIHEPQTGKLQKVLADLRVATLSIPEQVRKQLVEVVKENLDAFAGSPTDLGRTSVVVHTIKTGDAKPFRHKLRPIPFARRQYLEQEVAKLLSIGAVSEADPGACPYASRTVIAPKKDGSLRMCVDYRDINAQTEKDAYPLPRIDQVWPTLSKARYFRSPRPHHGLPPGRGRPEGSLQNRFPDSQRPLYLQRHALRPVQCPCNLSAPDGESSWLARRLWSTRVPRRCTYLCFYPRRTSRQVVSGSQVVG